MSRQKLPILDRVVRSVRLANRQTFRPANLKNRTDLLWSYLKGKPRLASAPAMVHMEVTNFCNLKCIMCPTPAMTRPKKLLQREDFDVMLRKLPAEIELIAWHSDGEPLLNKDLTYFIREANRRGFKSMMSTNATILTKEKGREILDAGLDFLTISMDGITRDTYNKIRLGGDFDSVMENIHGFLSVRPPSFPVVLQFIQQPDNEHETEQFFEYWKDKNVIPSIKPVLDWYVDDASEINLDLGCDRPWFIMVIQTDGSVMPCVHDYEGGAVMGNLVSQGFDEVWNSARFVEFRSNLARGRGCNTLCRKCTATGPRPHTPLNNMAYLLTDMSMVAVGLHLWGYDRPSLGKKKFSYKYREMTGTEHPALQHKEMNLKERAERVNLKVIGPGGPRD